MTFTFIHTADWQIGKSFGSMPPDKAPLLREVRLDVIDRIAGVAREAGAGHVLVAGDVYDSSVVSDRVIRQSLDRLMRNGHVTWHLLPGNHDPARAGGVWERLAVGGVPANVQIHLAPRPVAIADGIALLPAPLTAASLESDPTAWMDAVETPAGHHRIGLAHGSIQGFGSGDGEAKIPIDPGRCRTAGLSYLALGDWHGLTRISDRTWYAGTPEPDRFPDNEPGFVLVVRLDGTDGPPRVERRRTAWFYWQKRSVQVSGPGRLDALEGDILSSNERPERLLLRLAVTGSASLAAWSDAHARLARLGERIFHLEADTDGLQVLPEAVELEEFGSGDLGEVAQSLAALAADTADDRSAVASLALRKLHQFWRKAQPGGSP